MIQTPIFQKDEKQATSILKRVHFEQYISTTSLPATGLKFQAGALTSNYAYSESFTWEQYILR
jgi:hypothetical protein